MKTGAIKPAYLFNKRPLRTITAVMALGSFLFCTLFADISGALSFRTDLLRTGEAGSRAPRFIERFDAGKFELSEKLGRVDFSHTGPSEKTVIHIQDAHCNYNVQKVIEDILDHLNYVYGIRTVNLEGGKGAYDLSFFTAIRKEDSRRRVSDYFLEKGLINGAEYYAVNNRGRLELWGVEDKELYLRNLEVYRGSSGYRKKAASIIGELEELVSELKRACGNSGLLVLDAERARHGKGELPTAGYMNFLREKARECGVSAKGFRNMDALSGTLEAQESIDFDKAGDERDELINMFREIMSVNEVRQLESMMEAFGEGGIDRAEFYAYLGRKAADLGIEREKFPLLARYDEYVASFDEVDAVELKEEIAALEDRIRERLYGDGDERRIWGISRRLADLDDMFGLRMKEGAYVYFRENREQFEIAGQIQFLAGKARDLGIDAAAAENAADLDGYIKKMARFYEYSSERDDAFLRNLRFGDGQDVTVLITGGFHTERLMDLLRKEGYSYVSILPARRKIKDCGSPYFRILSGGMDPVSEALTPFIANLQVPSIMTDIAVEAFGRAGITTLKLTRNMVGLLGEREGPLVLTMRDGRRVRFSLAEGDLSVETDPADRAEGEVEIDIEVIRSAYLGIRREEEPEEEEGPAPRPREEARAPQSAPGIYDDREILAGPQGIRRLVMLLQELVSTGLYGAPGIAAVPDLHGVLRRLEDSLSKMSDDTAEKVFLGDYMDRGSESLKVIRRIMALKAEGGTVTLMGNHDLLFIMALMGNKKAMRLWLMGGGIEVLEEAGYNVSLIREGIAAIESNLPSREQEQAIERFIYANPEYAENLQKTVMQDPVLIEIAEWMKRNLALYHVGRNGVFYVHAGMPIDNYAYITLNYTDAGGVNYERLAALAKLEEEMRKAFVRKDADDPVLQFLCFGKPFTGEEEGYRAERSSPLWVRSTDSRSNSQNIIEMGLPNKEAKIMQQIGLSMQVAGHEPMADEATDLVSLANRMFYIDHYFEEEEGVVIFNDDQGWRYIRTGTDANMLLDKESFDGMWRESMQLAQALLVDLQRQYGDRLNPGSDLIGKLYDGEGELLHRIAVTPSPETDSIRIKNGATGEDVFDKHENVVEGLPVVKGREPETRGARAWALQELKFYLKALADKEDEDQPRELKVLEGAIGVIDRGEVRLLGRNEHGVVGIPDLSEGKPVIYLNEELLNNKEMFMMAMFHEAAEIFLADNADLVPKGMNAHKLLRGASKEERVENPDTFDKGIQDILFGEMNDDLTYEVIVAQEDFLFEDEVRFIAAVKMIFDGELGAAENMLLRNVPLPGIDPGTARVYMEAWERYLAAESGANRTRNREMLKDDPFNKALETIRDLLRDDPEDLMSYCGGTGSVLGALSSERGREMLEKIIGGDRDRPLAVIPSRTQRAVEKLKGTIGVNSAQKKKSGSVADLPADKEVIVVGDLHTRLDNLKEILSYEGNLAKILKGEIVLVIDGDAIHPDPHCFKWANADEMREKLADMKSSVEIMQFIQRLKRMAPESVYYVLGNHDYMSPRALKGAEKGKSGIMQGVKYRDELIRQFGVRYASYYQEFINTSPIMARTDDGLIVTHAGPIKQINTLEDVRNLLVSDDGSVPIWQATWARWLFDDELLGYRHEDVETFLEKVRGKVLVVSHTKDWIGSNYFYAELMPQQHYVTFAGMDRTGYLSWKNGEIHPVDVRLRRPGSSLAEEETRPADELQGALGRHREPLSDDRAEDFIRRVLELRKVLGDFNVVRTLGSGTWGTAVEATVDGGEFALKIAGKPTSVSAEQLERAKKMVTLTDVTFGITMKEATENDHKGYIPRIIGSGTYKDEPYICTEVLGRHRKIDVDMLRGMTPREILSLCGRLARVFTYLQEYGLVMFDAKPENLGILDGEITLMDTGSCIFQRSRLSRAAAESIEARGIEITESNIKGYRDCYKDFENRFIDKIRTMTERKVDAADMKRAMTEARSRENAEILYGNARGMAENLRYRSKPVVVFLQQPTAAESDHFRLIRKYERELKERYETDNLRIIPYDGTEIGLHAAIGKAESILQDPEAVGVAYVHPDLHPGRPGGKILYIKEECPAGDMLSLVGPHVALALALVNFRDGNASPELIRYMERTIRAMIDDNESLEYIRDEGVEIFLHGLLHGINSLKVKRVNFEDLRKAVEMQEVLLQSA